MSNFKKQLLAGPYLIWMIGFILLPLVFILYYAITAADGSFTFSNIAAIADPVHVKSILLSLKLGFLCTLVCLDFVLSALHDFKHIPLPSPELCRLFVHPPDVDEFYAAHSRVETSALQQRYCQCHFRSRRHRPCEDAQHSDRRCVRHGVRFSSFYDPADLQLHGADQQ